MKESSILWTPSFKLPKVTDLWDCRGLTLVPCLHHRTLRSHKGCLCWGGGNMRRVCPMPLPHPPAQQIPAPLLGPLGPSSLASRPVFQLYPVISCITIMKLSACFICNSDIAWVTLHWQEPWLESHQFNCLENLRYWLEFWLVPKNIYTHDLVCPQIHFSCPNQLHLFSFVNVK